MSTHSIIAMEKDGKIIGATCQYDGYPEHMGSELIPHFNSPDKVAGIFQHGDIREIEGGEVSYYKPPEGKDQLTEWNSRRALIRDAVQRVVSFVYLWEGSHWIFSSLENDWTDLDLHLKD